MQKIPDKILKSGETMPVLGFGTWTLHGEYGSNIIAYALQNGYRAIDTAQAYSNEETVADGIDKSGIKREDIFLTSKLRNRYHGYDNTLMAVELSLKQLRTDYLDLYLIHWPGEKLYVESWKALVRLYNEGSLKSIGVSNFYPHHLVKCAEETDIMPMVDQIEMHPYFQHYDTVEYCRKNDIFLISWSPLAAAGENRRDKKTGGTASADVLHDANIQKIAANHQKTVGQVILRWHIQNGFGAIPKSSNKERILENMQLFDFALTKEEMQIIQKLTHKQIRIGDDPETYRFPLLNELVKKGKVIT